MPKHETHGQDARKALMDLERQWAEAPGFLTSAAFPAGRLVPGVLLLMRGLVDRLEALEDVVHELVPGGRWRSETPPDAPGWTCTHYEDSGGRWRCVAQCSKCYERDNNAGRAA